MNCFQIWIQSFYVIRVGHSLALLSYTDACGIFDIP